MSKEKSNDIRNEPILTQGFGFRRQDDDKFSSGLLITGVTSFIGIHLLQEIHTKWPGPVYCLLKADSQQHAQLRIAECCEKWQLEKVDLSQTHLVIGNIRSSNWGLNDDT